MRETLKEALSAMEITLPEERIDTLCTFAQRVIAQNEVMNLDGHHRAEGRGKITSGGQPDGAEMCRSGGKKPH